MNTGIANPSSKRVAIDAGFRQRFAKTDTGGGKRVIDRPAPEWPQRIANLAAKRPGRVAARIGRNPATGEQIQIPAKRVVKFRVAKAAKDAILGART